MPGTGLNSGITVINKRDMVLILKMLAVWQAQIIKHVIAIMCDKCCIKGDIGCYQSTQEDCLTQTRGQE